MGQLPAPLSIIMINYSIRPPSAAALVIKLVRLLSAAKPRLEMLMLVSLAKRAYFAVHILACIF